jgi:hypothetical protein
MELRATKTVVLRHSAAHREPHTATAVLIQPTLAHRLLSAPPHDGSSRPSWKESECFKEGRLVWS